jgi:hypothetical protein
MPVFLGGDTFVTAIPDATDCELPKSRLTYHAITRREAMEAVNGDKTSSQTHRIIFRRKYMVAGISNARISV